MTSTDTATTKSDKAPPVVETSGKVIVACKIPNGLILRNYEMVEGFELVLGGGTRAVKTAQPVGDPITIKGPATPLGSAPSVQTVGGYALTHDVPAEFFRAWMKANSDLPAVRNGLIFAYAKEDSVRGEAKNLADVRSGLEPLSVEKILKAGKMVPVDPRVPQRIERGERA